MKVLVREGEDYYAATKIDEPGDDVYWSANCGQPVVMSPLPERWRWLPTDTGTSGAGSGGTGGDDREGGLREQVAVILAPWLHPDANAADLADAILALTSGGSNG